MNRKTSVQIERLNGGEPILAPQGDGWESTGTGNPGCIYIPGTSDNKPLIEKLLGQEPRAVDGIVAVIYTGCGARIPGVCSSACGLAVFTPRLELIKRFPEPILYSSGNPDEVDGCGMGDVRISRIDGTFYMLYSSWNGKEAYCCMAYSNDLLTWKRQGKMPGNINVYQNKDHVLFEQTIDGWHYCLHRPWSFPFEQKDYAIRLARSRSPMGPWQDCGTIMRALQHPKMAITWLGAGTVPIPLDGKRFLMIYHNGIMFEDGWREYDGSAAILDFNNFSLDRPENLVQAQLESFFVPETRAEKNPKESLRIDIVFPMGSYVLGDDIYIVYGAGDIYGCAARVNKDELVKAVETAGGNTD